MSEPCTEIADLPAMIFTVNNSIRMFEVELLLSTSIRLDDFGAVAFRGLLGWVLKETENSLFRKLFKPDEGGHFSPGFAVRQVSPAAPKTQSVVFRVMTLLDPDESPRRLAAQIVRYFPGRKFGMAQIHEVKINRYCYPASLISGHGAASYSGDFHFLTPMRLKRHGQIVDADNFSIAFVASGAWERLYALSGIIGLAVSPELAASGSSYVAGAALSLLRHRDITWRKKQRVSGVSHQEIFMDGCIGRLKYDRIPAESAMLLSWGSLVNLGRHSSMGAGAFDAVFYED